MSLIERRLAKLETARAGASTTFGDTREAWTLVDRHFALTGLRELYADLGADGVLPELTDDDRQFLRNCEAGKLSRARTIAGANRHDAIRPAEEIAALEALLDEYGPNGTQEPVPAKTEEI